MPDQGVRYTHDTTLSLTHSPTHLLTYSLTPALTHPPTHSLTHSLTHLLTHSLTHSDTLRFALGRLRRATRGRPTSCGPSLPCQPPSPHSHPRERERERKRERERERYREREKTLSEQSGNTLKVLRTLTSKPGKHFHSTVFCVPCSLQIGRPHSTFLSVP